MGLSYEDWIDPAGEYGHFAGADLFKRPPYKEYLIEHILYENDVICISSAPGVGKSMLALQLLCNMTSGQAFLDTYKVVKPLTVLYIQSEGDRAETLERLMSMSKGMKLNNDYWTHINVPGAMFNDREEFSRFLALIKMHARLYDVIIIDPLYTTVFGSLNSDEVATNWIRSIRELKGMYDCAVIINHHDAKDLYSEGMIIDRGNNISYGSVFWQAFFNHNFKLKVRQGVYTLEGGKQRNNKIIDKIEMKLMDDPLMFTCITDDSASNMFIVRAAIEKVVRAISAKELILMTGIAKATMYRILTKLVANKQIDVVHEPHTTFYKSVRYKDTPNV